MKSLKVVPGSGSYLPSLAQISQFESNQGIELPDDFKEFLNKQNPYETEEDMIVVDSVQYVVDSWFSLGGKRFELKEQYESIKKTANGKFIPFATDAGSLFFVLGLDKSTSAVTEFGKVYFWHYEHDDSREFTLLAASFTAFVNALTAYISPDEF